MHYERNKVVYLQVNSVSYEQVPIVWPAQSPTIEVVNERGFGAGHWLAAAVVACLH